MNLLLTSYESGVFICHLATAMRTSPHGMNPPSMVCCSMGRDDESNKCLAPHSGFLLQRSHRYNCVHCVYICRFMILSIYIIYTHVYIHIHMYVYVYIYIYIYIYTSCINTMCIYKYMYIINKYINK